MIRLFAAVSIPGEIGETLSLHQQGLAEARWRPVEALHITLRFFGELPEDRADDLELELSQVRGEVMTLELDGVGAFGEGSSLNAVWAGVRPNPALEQLARRCESAARRARLKPDTRAWRAHVTLAYPRRPDPIAVAGWIQANNLLRTAPFTAVAFGLYSSWRTQAGSRYRLERLYRLNGSST